MNCWYEARYEARLAVPCRAKELDYYEIELTHGPADYYEDGSYLYLYNYFLLGENHRKINFNNRQIFKYTCMFNKMLLVYYEEKIDSHLKPDNNIVCLSYCMNKL